MTKWACIVGLSYKTEHPDIVLLGAAGAARRFKKVLIKHFGYAEENIIMLFDEVDSSIGIASNILQNFDNMIGNAISGDSLLFFYCGHGGSGMQHTNIISDYYLRCSRDTYINGSELQSYMHKASSRELSLTVILDSCRSAGLFQGLAEEHLLPLTEGVELKSLTVPSPPIMIASCRKEQAMLTGHFPKKKKKIVSFYDPLALKPFRYKVKRVTKYVPSSDFVEAFRESIKLVNNKHNLELLNYTSGILIEQNLSKLLIDGEWQYHDQDPQLFCNDSQTVMMFSS